MNETGPPVYYGRRRRRRDGRCFVRRHVLLPQDVHETFTDTQEVTLASVLVSSPSGPAVTHNAAVRQQIPRGR